MRLYNILFFLTVGVLSCGVVNTSYATDGDIIVLNANCKTFEEMSNLCDLTESGDKNARHTLLREYPKFVYNYFDTYDSDNDSIKSFDELTDRMCSIIDKLIAKQEESNVMINCLIESDIAFNKCNKYYADIFERICIFALLPGNYTAKAYVQNNYKACSMLRDKVISGNMDAFNIIKEAAERGNTHAMLDLGFLYSGHGNVDAEYCLTKCAEKHNEAFSYITNFLAAEGSILAFECLIKHAENGNKYAIEQLKEVWHGPTLNARALNCLIKLKQLKTESQKVFTTHESIMIQWEELKKLMKLYEDIVVAKTENDRRSDSYYKMLHDKLLGLFDAQLNVLNHVIGLSE